MRADRLLNLLLLLQNRGKMSSRQLAELLEVSERTIVRDIEALSAAGIPVYAERGSRGGWVLADSYRTNLTGMRPEEIVSLLLANHNELLKDLGIQGDFQAAYQKLLAVAPAPIRQDAELIRERLHIDGAGWHASEEAFPWLSAVQEAVWAQRKLRIRYRKEEGITERIIHPLGLVAKRNVWYVAAEQEPDGELRTFRISRLEEASLLDETFMRPEGFDLAAYWEQSTARFKSELPRYVARVRTTEAGLDRLRKERFIKVLQVENSDNQGQILAEVDLQTLDWACGVILRIGRDAEVLEPQELRERVISEAQAILALYGHLD
ncbi:helix-turn-helix transcriptional regulator [Paenibacillus barengoltzii]|uniref:Predicted DNA-binding transcriptional regulator YafY, contains an HTH and WYL domains n=1 Tax=Paenibacillus barengoltzii J12 TaxID=935846 RepID=A0ABY1M3H3_9BACL|nr:YafY family protein [Paenibacillus barengoltzii]SMF68344.1 Predicted DNA-binding transcriptional regulator YafY, contains an HTH and WYL domains [Paenibacillus barengoltzii J12]